MKIALENILKAILPLSDKSQEFILKQLKSITDKYNGLLSINDSYKRQLSGITPKQFNDHLIKSVEMLKIFGFTEFTFVGFNPDFLNWFFENTQTITKFNPKLMNYYLLESVQQSYFITLAENNGEEPTYNAVKNTLLTFEETIKDYEKESKLSLTELINKLDG
jgi:hypothetical protein